MSTITQPRDSSLSGRRIPLASTPTSSSRPSLEATRSLDSSPAPQPQRRNRTALREYYNLRSKVQDTSALDDAASEVSSSSIHDFSEIPESLLDRPDFDAQKYIKEVLETQTLEELLKTYNGVLSDVRALDAEKKALVYDNYSKLIVATETIKRMRERMGPLGPMAGTLDPAVERIWERVEGIKEGLREEIGEDGGRWIEMDGEEREIARRKERSRRTALRALEMPERLRELVAEGKEDEARREWDPILKLLERWKEREVGGNDVQACIDDGEAALRGEPPSTKSWVNVTATEVT